MKNAPSVEDYTEEKKPKMNMKKFETIFYVLVIGYWLTFMYSL